MGWGPCCRPATEAFDDGSAGPLAAPSQRRFFALLVAAGRQAYFPENQVYLELLADHGCAAAYPYDGGFVLRPARESFVASRPGMTVRAPFEQAAHGRMMMYTEDELSALLLAPTGLDCVQKIELTKLKWAYPGDAHGDDIGDTWAIIGLDASVEKVVMVAEVPVGPAPGGAPPNADDDFDILADLEIEARHARKRQRLAAAAVSAAGGLVRPDPIAIVHEVDELGQVIAEMLDCGADAAELLALTAEGEAEEEEELRGLHEDEEGDAEHEVAEPAEPEPEAPAEVAAAPVDDYQVFLDSLSIEILSNHNVQDKLTGLPVGNIRKSFRDGSMKATCAKGHNKCACWISMQPGEEVLMDRQVQMDLLRWLDEANRGADENAHWRSSIVLRRDKYKMRLKKT